LNTGIQKFKKGSIIDFRFMFPDGVKRLVFAMAKKDQPNQTLVEQVIDNPSAKKGLAEVSITDVATNWMGEGSYVWKIFALNTDGTRDTWFPYSDGALEIYDGMGLEKAIELLP
jgi:hypothetical protein